MVNDVYKTLIKPSTEILFKDKNSKFYGYAFPVSNEDHIKVHLKALRKLHHSARHWCYAYQIGHQDSGIIYRANDDGEPNNSAGMPIYGQIQSFELTNVLVVVVRYFGGVKLGVGGLINAYKTAAFEALNNSELVKRTINEHYRITFDYKNMNKVMRIIKEKKIKVLNQKLELNCQIDITIRRRDSEKIAALFKNLHEVAIKTL